MFKDTIKKILQVIDEQLKILQGKEINKKNTTDLLCHLKLKLDFENILESREKEEKEQEENASNNNEKQSQ